MKVSKMNTGLDKKIKNWIIGLLFTNIIVFGAIIFHGDMANAFYFFDVGQGDGQMISVDGANFIIDAGGGSMVLDNLSAVMPSFLRYIDVVFISHPQIDHAEGLLSILKYYDIGVVIYGGQQSSLWDKIKVELENKNIPYIALTRGDFVKYGDSEFSVLWPEAKSLYSKDMNDLSMVLKFCGLGECALYTGDLPGETENLIAGVDNIKSDILKVSHHGSRYSSETNFLNKVEPKVAIIGVGKNSYGHPTKEALDRLSLTGAEILRTDMEGMIKIIPKNNFLQIFKLSK